MNLVDDLIELRREIHRHPELAGEERETAGLVSTTSGLSEHHECVTPGRYSRSMVERLRLAKIDRDNVAAACRLAVRPDQDSFVAPVAVSLAEAYAQPDVAWPRLVYDGDELVGFVMGGFDPDSPIPFFRCGIWRLNIAAEQQGKGYGRFAACAVLDEARRRGQRRATVLWVPGSGGPEGFYLKLGFKPTGEQFHGQIVGEISLD